MRKKLLLFITTAVIFTIITISAFAGARHVSNKNFNKQGIRYSTSASARYVGNRRTKKLHDRKHSTCRNYIRMMAKKNKVYFKSKAQAARAGYKLCKPCSW